MNAHSVNKFRKRIANRKYYAARIAKDSWMIERIQEGEKIITRNYINVPFDEIEKKNSFRNRLTLFLNGGRLLTRR